MSRRQIRYRFTLLDPLTAAQAKRAQLFRSRDGYRVFFPAAGEGELVYILVK